MKLVEGKKKDEEEKWCIRPAGKKCTNEKNEVKGGQLHITFSTKVESTLGEDFSKLGDGDDFMWHQFHAEDWGAQ